MGELFDIHFHLPDPATFPAFANSRGKRLLLRFLLRGMRDSAPNVTRESIEEYNRGMLRSIEASMLDRVVLLALDAPHDGDGARLDSDGALLCSNEYVAALAAASGKTLFGASVHPYRKDAIKELERCIDRGACLVKWLPSTQIIDPRDKRCLPFYEFLAAQKLPLLCHTGCEHTLPGADNGLNDPERLLPALKQGVTVIAAHCGARLLLHERCYFGSWRRLALEHENCFGDLSAFVTPTRMHLLSRIRKDERLLSKVLYGSDSPSFVDPLSTFFGVGARRSVSLLREQNPVNRALRVLRDSGFPESVFSRAGSLLRLRGTQGKE